MIDVILAGDLHDDGRMMVVTFCNFDGQGGRLSAEGGLPFLLTSLP